MDARRTRRGAGANEYRRAGGRRSGREGSLPCPERDPTASSWSTRRSATSGGHATAAAIPGAGLVLIPGMGHNLPEDAWPPIIDAIVRNTKG
jgi:pimeloyl-ACP methyl ester carboxylesterase